MIRRLKIKFVCINMLIVMAMQLVIFGLVLHITSRNIEDQSMHILQSILEEPKVRGPMMRERRVPHFVVTVSAEGKLTVSSGGFFDLKNEQLLQIARDTYEGGAQQGHLKDENLRFLRSRTPMGEALIFVDTSMERTMMEQLLKTCGTIFVVSFLLIFLISVFLAQWAVRPVETAWDNQRQFVADASHELKTPLTVIITNAELLQERIGSAEDNGQFSGNILTMAHQMRGLVEGLLNLARVDNGVVKTVFTDVAFSTLVADCVLPFEPMFFESGMVLETDIQPDICVRGSEAHLRQLVDILLDNAVKYGTSEHPVRITLHRQGRMIQLCVSTAGESLSREDLKNIFKRFYRIDKARAMNHSYGLGLSIAESIVKDHRGKIWATSKNSINSFYVQLPYGGWI